MAEPNTTEQGGTTTSPKADSSSGAKMVGDSKTTGGGDTVDGTVLASGAVNYNGKAHQLLLLQRGLRLVPSEPDSKPGDQGSDVPVIDVPWREVVCACEPPVKKSKSSVGEKKPEAADPANKMFVVHYMVRNAKTYKVQCKSVTLESTQDTAEGWIVQIEEKRKEGKAQKLLIIINPIGGGGNARQLFTKKVQPLFALAGVELVVKVTERSHHAVEIAKTFDVASVDGVVVMSGDGMYMEVLHALTLRKQEEEGVDYNNPEAKLIPPTVRIGIIPAGSANGMSEHFYGVIDLDTATLNIIRGETDRANIFSFHEGQKLAQYGGLFFSNGYFSLFAKRTEEMRWMGKARYAYVLLGHVFGKKKMVEFDIEVLKSEEDQGNKEEDGKEEGAEAASSAGWVKLGSRQLAAVFAMVTRILPDPEGLMITNPFRPNFDLMFLKSGAIMDNCRFLYAFSARKLLALERPFIEWVRNIRGIRLKMVQSTTEGAASRQTETEEMCKMLNVDGEVIYLSQPSCEVRIHSQFLQVFAFPEHFNKSTPPSGTG